MCIFINWHDLWVVPVIISPLFSASCVEKKGLALRSCLGIFRRVVLRAPCAAGGPGDALRRKYPSSALLPQAQHRAQGHPQARPASSPLGDYF